MGDKRDREVWFSIVMHQQCGGRRLLLTWCQGGRRCGEEGPAARPRSLRESWAELLTRAVGCSAGTSCPMAGPL